MWLTKNEKKVLKLLIDDAKLSDTSIANKLKISSQAIGRIRKKLEEDIIKGYTVELDLKMLGLNTVSVTKYGITQKGLELDEEEIENKISSIPNNVTILRLSTGNNSYEVNRICSSLDECEMLEKEKSLIFEGNKILERLNVERIPLSNQIKSDINSLLHKAIDDLGTKSTKINWKEK